MRKSFIITIFQLAIAIVCSGQFTYFNNYYLPQEWELGNSGISSNLLVRNDSLMSFGEIYAQAEFHRWFQFFDFEGTKLGESLTWEYGEQWATQYNESIRPFLDNGFIWGGNAENYDSLDIRPLCIRYNEDLTVNWSRKVNWLLTGNDTVDFAEFHFAQPLANNDLFCAGPVYYNIDDDNWSDISGLLVARYSADGDSIYEKVIPFWQEEYEEFNEFGLRLSGATELEDGSILISGFWNGSNDTEGLYPCFIKVNSEGEFIEQFRFEILCADWLPWLLPLANGNIAFAYSKCTDTYFPDDDLTPIRNIRMGLFDPDSMDTLWTKTFDHTFLLHTLHDFVSTPDGGYAALSFVTGQIDDFEFSHNRGAFILKTDSELNEEWFRFIPEPIPGENGASLSAYDLEVTPDGGFAALGNFIPIADSLDGVPLSADYTVTWLFKTDCMGFIAPPDMQLFSNVEQLNDSTFYCSASGEAYQNFVWNFGNGDVVEGDTLTYVYDESGEFTITLNASSCMTQSGSSWDVTSTVGIPTFNFQSSMFSVFPNPFEESFNISSSTTLKKIELRDAVGRIVLSEVVGAKQTEFETTHLAKGVYVLRMEDEYSNVRSARVVKE